MSDEDFISAWQACDSLPALAEKLGYDNVNTPAQRARNMRKQGVPLKRYASRTPGKKDAAYWARMAQLASTATSGDDDSEEE